MIRRKVFKLLGEAFHIYDEAGRVILYSKMKAFRLREDIRLYESDAMREELLLIAARNVIDFSAAYDVTDVPSGERVGTLKRRGISSLVRDTWLIEDAAGREIGHCEEDSLALSLVRRTVLNILPQNFTGQVDGRDVFHFRRRFNPFILKMDLDFTMDTAPLLDRRLGLALGVLLSAIEGRQD
jgi:uncharacterized protein YxjI